MIYKLNSNLVWKLLGNVVGITPIALPNSFSELYVSVMCENMPKYTFYILKQDIGSGNIYGSGEGNGFNGVCNYNFAEVKVNTQEIRLYYYYILGKNNINSATVKVYYR